ncbi:hypothetical protein [Methanohalophilus halophilus]|nr:hypothetical protein [Methanohalophilus halophilus]
MWIISPLDIDREKWLDFRLLESRTIKPAISLANVGKQTVYLGV